MSYVSIKELCHNPEKHKDAVTVKGWIRNIRDSKVFGFIELNDGSIFKSIQIVFEENSIENFKDIVNLNIGAAVSVTGVVILTPDAKQPFEIKATSVVIEGTSTPDYPLQPKRHSMEFLRSIAHLRPRTNTFSAVFRVRSAAAFAIHKFFNEDGFIYVHTPIVTGSDCEGAGAMFQVTTLDLENPPRDDNGQVNYKADFFSSKTALTVSGQLEFYSYPMISDIKLNNNTLITSADINQIIQAINSYTEKHADVSISSVADVKNNAELMTVISNTWHS